MKRFFAPLTALLTLLLMLSACSAGAVQAGESAAPTEAPAESATLEELCGDDYQAYITETITMQMGNRMDKDSGVAYFPITNHAPLTDYTAIDETTAFQIDGDGNIVILFPAGTVTDESHGQQSFRIPKP